MCMESAGPASLRLEGSVHKIARLSCSARIKESHSKQRASTEEFDTLNISVLPGCLKPWTARLGSLDAASGTFTDRREAHASAGASRRGFCGIMTPGEVYVGAPGMSAICAALSQHANIDGKWGAKVKTQHQQLPALFSTGACRPLQYLRWSGILDAA